MMPKEGIDILKQKIRQNYTQPREAITRQGERAEEDSTS